VRMVLGYVARTLRSYVSDETLLGSLPTIRIRNIFNEHKSKLASEALDDLRKLGLLDAQENLTREATLILRDQLKQAHSRL